MLTHELPGANPKGAAKLPARCERERRKPMMKQIRIEATLAGVALVIEGSFDEAGIDKLAKAGMASELYRATATKAFKGVKREELAYEEAEKRIRTSLPEGWTLVNAEPYVAPEKAEANKRASKLVADAIANGKLDKLVEICGFKGDKSDTAALIARVNEWQKNPLA